LSLLPHKTDRSLNTSFLSAMEPIKVCLVNDHKIFLEGLVRLLKDRSSIQVVGTAINGRMALKQVRALHPDVVLMDISMPDLNGIEAARLLRKASPKTKVIILSMYENEEFLRKVLESGVSGYLLKDSTAEEVCLAIEQAHEGNSYLSPVLSRRLIDHYLEIKKGKRPKNLSPTLTGREREVLQLLAEGKSNQEIAKILDLSMKTIETHRKRMMKKLGIHHLAELVKYAIRTGIIEI
jgi:DNA-binding NarL/FixJ family response regulator